MEHRDFGINKIYNIENCEERNNELKKQLNSLEEQMYIICFKMDGIRGKYSELLEKGINKELADLEMPNAKFYVR